MVFYVTVRCVNRSFRPVPNKQVREAIAFCLAVTLEKYRNLGRIQLHEFEFLSNHYHLLGTTLTRHLPDFIRELNGMLSSQLNALRGISGKNIEPNYGLVELVGHERIVEQAVYTQANPVAAFLVAKAQHWRSVSSRSMEYGVPVRVEKPKTGIWAGKVAHAQRASSKRSKRAAYASRSRLPEAAHMVIDRPAILPHLSDQELRALIRSKLEKREEEVATERQRRGIRVLGWRKAQEVNFLALPAREEMFARNPTFAASTTSERVWLAKVKKTFLELYAEAREAFERGVRGVTFPEGTYFLRRRFNVRCCPFAVP